MQKFLPKRIRAKSFETDEVTKKINFSLLGILFDKAISSFRLTFYCFNYFYFHWLLFYAFTKPLFDLYIQIQKFVRDRIEAKYRSRETHEKAQEKINASIVGII